MTTACRESCCTAGQFFFSFFCVNRIKVVKFKMLIMLRVYLATEVFFYFNIALYVWLLMTFKEGKVK